MEPTTTRAPNQSLVVIIDGIDEAGGGAWEADGGDGDGDGGEGRHHHERTGLCRALEEWVFDVLLPRGVRVVLTSRPPAAGSVAAASMLSLPAPSASFDESSTDLNDYESVGGLDGSIAPSRLSPTVVQDLSRFEDRQFRMWRLTTPPPSQRRATAESQLTDDSLVERLMAFSAASAAMHEHETIYVSRRRGAWSQLYNKKQFYNKL